MAWKPNEDTILTVLRNQALERAIGELKCALATCYTDYEKPLSTMIEKVIKMLEEGEGE